MEPPQLSLALLLPQVTVAGVLGELLNTLPRRDETSLKSLNPLYSKLMDFIGKLWATMESIEGTWWHRDVTSNNKAPPASLSQALAAYESTPWTTWLHVTMEAWHMLGSLNGRLDNWAELARAAIELRNTCREVASEAADRAATATTRARELQDKAACCGTAQENMVELGQALGREELAQLVARFEAQKRTEAMLAASEATRATMERQRLEAALGLLERLVAACDEAAAFHRELQWRLRDIEAALEGTNEASPDVPEDLVAKVAKAERMWEANTRLAKDHLLGAVDNIIEFDFNADPASPGACEVAERCQRAIKDVLRLLQPAEHPQNVPKVSPVSTELQELSLALLKPKPQVTVMATLGELVGITARQDVLLPMCQPSLHEALENFTKNLRDPLHNIAKPFWRHHYNSDLTDALTSLSRALAAYENTPWTTWDQVRSVASKWHRSVSTLEDSWAQLTREAIKLRDACRDVANGRGIAVAMEEVSRKGIEEAVAGAIREGVIDVGGAVVAESQARVVKTMRQQAEEALGLLKHLVIACRKITVFYRELQHMVGGITDTMRGTGELCRDFRAALAAKVTKAEWLWMASSLLARDHLVGALGDIHTIFRCGDPDGSIARAVFKRCQRAAKDIPNLLQGQ